MITRVGSCYTVKAAVEAIINRGAIADAERAVAKVMDYLAVSAARDATDQSAICIAQRSNLGQKLTVREIGVVAYRDARLTVQIQLLRHAPMIVRHVFCATRKHFGSQHSGRLSRSLYN